MLINKQMDTHFNYSIMQVATGTTLIATFHRISF